MRNVLIANIGFGKSYPQALNTLKEHAHVIENLDGIRFQESDFFEKLHGIDVLILGTEKITPDIIKQSHDLKLIARVGSGIDNIDTKAAMNQKISITYTPTAPKISVPEFTLALMLNLLKGIHISDRRMHQKDWVRPMGQMLSSMVCGIIGAGNIGKEVIKKIKVISPETEILFFDPFVNVIESAKKVELNELARTCNIISLHVPLVTQTLKIINKSFLEKMKKGSYLINTSRGEVVDEKALYEALKSGHLQGAALDVFEIEPYNGDLMCLENCILTSHIGSMVKESRALMEQQIVEDVVRFFHKQELLRPLRGFDFTREI